MLEKIELPKVLVWQFHTFVWMKSIWIVQLMGLIASTIIYVKNVAIILIFEASINKNVFFLNFKWPHLPLKLGPTLKFFWVHCGLLDKVLILLTNFVLLSPCLGIEKIFHLCQVWWSIPLEIGTIKLST